MVFLSCLVALAICVTLRRKLNNVRQKVQANEYITPDGCAWQTVMTVTHIQPKPVPKSNGKVRMAGGHTSSRSGGGGSGRSGKF